MKKVTQLFKSEGATLYYVDLKADLDERIQRNKSSNRLQHKPSKRNVEWSENELKRSLESYRLNSLEGEINFPNYMKINNTNLSAEEVAELVKREFNL